MIIHAVCKGTVIAPNMEEFYSDRTFGQILEDRAIACEMLENLKIVITIEDATQEKPEMAEIQETSEKSNTLGTLG